ncbi:MAG: hypothetical protein K2G87_04625 [Oscillospiraceae bacterium]|nr:hypothetical protein [Oscillospiraceae bacterium]
MVSEKKKASNRKWDKENMKTVACFIRKEDAELFKKICNENGTTPAQHLKRHITEVIEKYYEDNAGK